VAAAFSHALADDADYDLSCSLLVTATRAWSVLRAVGRRARRIRFRARSGVALGRASQSRPDRLGQTAATAGAVVPEWRGRITGLSLHALVFTPEGRGVFQGFGGLDLVHDAVRES
jgi:hypothetical protein